MAKMGRKRNSWKVELLLTFISVGYSIYVAYINTKNLHINAATLIETRRNTIASAHIASELRRLNNSQFLCNVNKCLDKEE